MPRRYLPGFTWIAGVQLRRAGLVGRHRPDVGARAVEDEGGVVCRRWIGILEPELDVEQRERRVQRDDGRPRGGEAVSAGRVRHDGRHELEVPDGPSKCQTSVVKTERWYVWMDARGACVVVAWAIDREARRVARQHGRRLAEARSVDDCQAEDEPAGPESRAGADATAAGRVGGVVSDRPRRAVDREDQLSSGCLGFCPVKARLK